MIGAYRNQLTLLWRRIWRPLVDDVERELQLQRLADRIRHALRVDV